jgi:cob(I)alamin adenosyltransferase
MAVRINRVYTRTGDDGTTGLGDFSRTHKTDPRLAAYADADESGAVIGVCVTTCALPTDVRDLLVRVQNDLFDVGADLCLPLADSYAYEPLRVRQEWISELETAIDHYNDALPKLTTFVLAGGTPASARASGVGGDRAVRSRRHRRGLVGGRPVPEPVVRPAVRAGPIRQHHRRLPGR